MLLGFTSSSSGQNQSRVTELAKFSVLYYLTKCGTDCRVADTHLMKKKEKDIFQDNSDVEPLIPYVPDRRSY